MKTLIALILSVSLVTSQGQLIDTPPYPGAQPPDPGVTLAEGIAATIILGICTAYAIKCIIHCSKIKRKPLPDPDNDDNPTNNVPIKVSAKLPDGGWRHIGYMTATATNMVWIEDVDYTVSSKFFMLTPEF